MSEQDALKGLDLNLLVALDALVTERNVTRAASRTGVGQSAMSSSLARLRRHLGDELLTRAADGMRLTPRAIALEEPLRAVLRQIRILVSRGGAFDPSQANRTFTIAIPDGGELLFVPPLLALCRVQAPGVHIDVRTFERTRYTADLDSDRLDLAVGFGTTGFAHHKQRLLYRDHYVVLFNDALLDVGVPIKLKDYVRIPHVMTSFGGPSGGAVEEALAAIGKARTVVARTPRFLMVPNLVRAAPVLATMGAKLARLFAGPAGLTISPMPLKVAAFATNMVWHASYDEDPGHKWLRQILLRTAAALES